MTVAWLNLLFCRDLDDLAKEVDLFEDESRIWTTVPGITNSAGTLTLHLCGNIQHFIGTKLGGRSYVRDRDREFAARGLTRAELKAEIARTREAVVATLTALPESRLSELCPFVPTGMRLPTGLFLMHLATHLSYHLGQLAYVRRVVTGQAVGSGAIGFAGLAPAAMPE